jgi:hypothetical protein
VAVLEHECAEVRADRRENSGRLLRDGDTRTHRHLNQLKDGEISQVSVGRIA